MNAYSTIKIVDRFGNIKHAAAIRSTDPEADRKTVGRIVFKDGSLIDRGFCETREEANEWMNKNPEMVKTDVPRMFE